MVVLVTPMESCPLNLNPDQLEGRVSLAVGVWQGHQYVYSLGEWEVASPWIVSSLQPREPGSDPYRQGQKGGVWAGDSFVLKGLCLA